MENILEKHITLVTSALLDNKKAVKAFRFISPSKIIRAVRRTAGGKIQRGNIYISLTIGTPNYAERELIKKMKKLEGKVTIGATFLKKLK